MTEVETKLAETEERLKQMMAVVEQLQKENKELKRQKDNHLAQNGFEELVKQFLTQFKASRRRHKLATYLLTIKQKEGENLKAYLTLFNKEMLTMNDQDEKITLATLLGGIWPRSPLMAELARRTPSTCREFMDRADNFVNAEDTLQALLEKQKKKAKRENKNQNNSKDKDKGTNGRGHQDDKRNRYTSHQDQGRHLIHNNHNVQENSRATRKEEHSPCKGQRHCTYHRTNSHWTEDCITLKK
ncbi:uncharacterized protein LOC121239726 [Juglans microcarpa x Juglans regia]|uniref:uncharacterized protein LOC121239726 n=1 Tax=Juglans microcarpa x Juglans regia TaxID=2249226 RepID=UPI001B7F531A|nr:uncharacterized protein LOC121239726 [Juglans microcarpa x Juglans regia]